MFTKLNQNLYRLRKFSLFFAIFEKFSLSLRFAQEKDISFSLRRKKLKKFAFALLSQSKNMRNFEPWLNLKFQEFF